MVYRRKTASFRRARPTRLARWLHIGNGPNPAGRRFWPRPPPRNPPPAQRTAGTAAQRGRQAAVPENLDPTPMDLPPSEHQISFGAEVQRKALHLLALALPAGVLWLGRPTALGLLIPAAVLAVGADVLRVRSAGFARFINTVFGGMMRPEERPQVGDDVRINGATWVLVSLACVTLLFPLPIAIVAFASFMIGDACAALVGRRFGRTRWPNSPRTVEGSVAFVLAALVVMGLFPGIPWWVAGAGAVLGAGAEALPGPLNDNVRVPLVIGGLLFALERLVLAAPLALFG